VRSGDQLTLGERAAKALVDCMHECGRGVSHVVGEVVIALRATNTRGEAPEPGAELAIDQRSRPEWWPVASTLETNRHNF
jgi:hypothetical protein